MQTPEDLGVITAATGRLVFAEKRREFVLSCPDTGQQYVLESGDRIAIRKWGCSLPLEQLPPEPEETVIINGLSGALLTLPWSEVPTIGNIKEKHLFFKRLPFQRLQRTQDLVLAYLRHERVEVTFRKPRLTRPSEQRQMGHFSNMYFHYCYMADFSALNVASVYIGHPRQISVKIGDMVTIFENDGTILWRGRMTKRRLWCHDRPRFDRKDTKAIRRAFNERLAVLVEKA